MYLDRTLMEQIVRSLVNLTLCTLNLVVILQNQCSLRIILPRISLNFLEMPSLLLKILFKT